MKPRIPALFSRKEFINVVNDLSGIEIIPMFGTLLGLYRDGNIIDDDDDIDFCAHVSERKKLKKRLSDKGYSIDENEYPNHTDYFLQFYKEINGIKIYFDFYFWDISDDKKLLIVRWPPSETEKREKDLHIDYCNVYPTIDFQHFDLKLSFPNKAKECIESFYGKKWQIHLKKYLDYDFEYKKNRIKINYFNNNERINKRDAYISELESQVSNKELIIKELRCEILRLSDFNRMIENNIKKISNEEHVKIESEYDFLTQSAFSYLADLLMKAMTSYRIAQRNEKIGTLIPEPEIMAFVKVILDEEWYIRTNPDVHAAGVDPFLHFLEHGYEEGRSPRPLWK